MPVAHQRLFTQHFRRLIHISRPVLWINTVGPAFIGLWLTGDLWNVHFLPILVWLSLPFNLLIYGINDLSDLDTDQTNDRKNSWEGAKIDPNEFRLIISCCAALNLPFLVLFVFYSQPKGYWWLLVYVIVFLIYSLPPRLKARPILDSLSNAAYGLPLVFVPLLLGSQVMWTAAAGLMTWGVAKHCYDAIQDQKVDASVGLVTTPVLLGGWGALVFCLGFWLVSTMLLGQLSVALGIINLLYSLGLIIGMAINFWSGTIESDARNGLQELPQVSETKFVTATNSNTKMPTIDRLSLTQRFVSHRTLYKASVGFPYVVGTFGGILLAASIAKNYWTGQ